MKLFATIAAGLAFCACHNAWSAPTMGYIDVYGVADFDLNVDVDELGEADFEGDGYGVKGAVTIVEGLFASAEYQEVDYELAERGSTDVTDTDFDNVRAGLGMRFEDGPALFFVRGEYVKLDLEANGESVDEDGYGLHAGVRGENGRFGLTIEGGYVKVGDFGGLEWQVEADYRMLDALGMFIGYRRNELDNHDEADLTYSDVRVGATLYFGGKSV